MSRKGKEVLAVKASFDQMSCRTEEVGVAYQLNFLIRWVEKGSDKDQGGGDMGTEKRGMMMRTRSRLRLRNMNGVFNKVGGDVSVGMRTIHKDINCLLKRATDVEKKTSCIGTYEGVR
ncbi:hypothetical protein Syun_021332 [Stephania yunnanensis]|uniref:Uncharacterized protein n=1 Tax=Stephania yunnanensis TaxID=152371 RepID=A0AAP0NQZ1_9MAGN